jgi:exopolysaccharide production protein ExoQ
MFITASKTDTRLILAKRRTPHLPRFTKLRPDRGVAFPGVRDAGIIPRMSPSPGSFRLWQHDKSGATFAVVLIWIMITVMIVPQGLDYAGINGMPTSSDALNRFLWLFLLGAGIFTLGQRLARTKTLARWLNPFLLGFMALAGASILWSIDPGVSIRRVLRAATIVMICMAFTLVGWNAKRFQNVVRPIMTTIMVASVIFVIVDWEDAVHHGHQVESVDAWHGVAIGKNILGSLASIGVVLWLHGWLSKEVKPFNAVCGIAVSALNLIMSRSAASLMSTVFAVMFMLILLRAPGTLKRYMPHLVAIFATVTLIYALAVLRLVPGMEIFLKPIAMFTGKDLTFTGRTAIWEIMNEHIRLRPFFGSGYGAYWVGKLPSSPSYEMFTRLYFYPTEAHNGYLDVINDLGIAGGVFLFGYFASYVHQSLQMYRFDRYQAGLYLTLLFRGFMADMSESHWFLSLSVDFIIMTLATTALARGLLQHQLNKAHPLPTHSAPEPKSSAIRPRVPVRLRRSP